MNTSGHPSLVDLSHPIEHGMATLKGFPGPICAITGRARLGAEL